MRAIATKLNDYRNGKSQRNRNEKDPKEGTNTSQEIEFVNFPQFVCRLIINKPYHCCYDDGC